MTASSRLGRRAFLLFGAAALAAGGLGQLPAALHGEALGQGPPAPASRTLDVPAYRQAYALSCEAASLRMALAYRGVTTDDAAILRLIGADTRRAFYRDGVLRWGNPYSRFVGDVSGSEASLTGYGTYHPSVARAAAALWATVLVAAQGISPAALYSYVLGGHPAIVWVTYRWVPAARSDYVAFDGTPVPYAGPVEHSVLVAGVTPTSVLVNDPASGRYWVSKGTFETAYHVYNQMAVVIS